MVSLQIRWCFFSHCKQFTRIDSLSNVYGTTTEIYPGWPNQGQMQQLTQHADRILLHAYRTSNIDVYQYTQSRIYDIASAQQSGSGNAHLSSEPNLWDHGSQQTDHFYLFRPMMPCLNRNQLPSKQNISLQGYQWFLYPWCRKSSLPRFNQQQWTTKFLFRWKCHTYCKYRFILFCGARADKRPIPLWNSSENYLQSTAGTGASGNSATSPGLQFL